MSNSSAGEARASRGRGPVQYYAVIVQEGGPEEHYILPADNPEAAKTAALKLLAGYPPKAARLEVYRRGGLGRWPLLVWCRLS